MDVPPNDDIGSGNDYWVNDSTCLYSMSLRPFYLKREYPYRNGKLHGLLKEFYTSGPAGGKIRSTKEYVDGVKHGEYKYFNESGQMITCITYENGKEKGSCIP